VSEAEAVAGGVNKAIAHRIYTDLAYLGSMAGKIVVVPIAWSGSECPSKRPGAIL